jgi:hypothetical protein
VIACDAFGGADCVTTGADAIRVSISHGHISLLGKVDHDEGQLRRVVPFALAFHNSWTKQLKAAFATKSGGG